jgi:hypothetical protein
MQVEAETRFCVESASASTSGLWTVAEHTQTANALDEIRKQQIEVKTR